jgi:hypothetical protein
MRARANRGRAHAFGEVDGWLNTRWPFSELPALFQGNC